MSDVHPLQTLFALSLTALTITSASVRADGPLAELLAAAPNFHAQFQNNVVNSADLNGQISVYAEAAPTLQQSTVMMPENTLLLVAPASVPQVPEFTITGLATSVQGVVQLGGIRVDSFNSISGAESTPSTSASDLIDPFERPAVPIASDVTLGNQAVNTGNISGSIGVSGINRLLMVSDQSTNAEGAVSIGQIRISINE